ncbi:ABC transporter permease subunit [Nonomuraea aridisoli]|uniref:ABC transporter permease n=1 Tax=Nonomuraea aridisoli TaxID=2070368 RepID=A0A2W2ECZ7_9ACTN|nr:ABC transporter permease subunit [Nonomuraea aridisoli]PZG07217.1 ABC transporter permease [Nonomuraea aridisoli]
MKAVVSSEWLKLRSVTSTYHALATAALPIVLGIVWTVYVTGLADERGSVRAAAPEQGFLPLLQTSLAVLGVLAITSEYATGTIRTSLVAVPKRGALLLAKSGVVGLTTFLAAHVILFVTYATSRLIAGDHHLGFNEASFADEVPMLLASGLSATALALVGLGLGALIRSTAGAIVSVVALLFVLPGIAIYLPPPWNTRVATLLLPNLVPQIAEERLSSRLGDGFLPPWAALTLLLAYPLVTLAIGYYALKRRDA